MSSKSRLLRTPFSWECVVGILVLTLVVGTVHADDMVYPLGAAVDKDGTLFVVDLKMHGVWKVADGKVSPFFKGSKKFRTPLNAARCITIDNDGNILVGDTSTREIYRFDNDGKPQPVIKTKTGIGTPMGMAVAKDGTIFVSDLEVRRIWKVRPEGGEPEEFAAVPAPRGLTFDGDGNLYVVSVSKDHSLIRLKPDAKVEIVVKGHQFQFPHDVVLDKDKNAYVSDGYGKCVWKVTPDGEAKKWATYESFNNPVGLAWRGENLLIVDPRAKAIFQADGEGKVTKLGE